MARQRVKRGQTMETPPQTKHRFVRLAEVIQLTGMSERQIYRKMKAGEFPKSYAIGAKSKVWLESEIQQWISDKINQTL